MCQRECLLYSRRATDDCSTVFFERSVPALLTIATMDYQTLRVHILCSGEAAGGFHTVCFISPCMGILIYSKVLGSFKYYSPLYSVYSVMPGNNSDS